MGKEYLDWAKEFFKEDTYAMDTTGVVIEEADTDYAKCSLCLDRKHKNANNSVMGGAIYTLVDVTFAVAANSRHTPTVSLNANIEYLNAVPCEGSLYAEAKCIKSGRSICRFDINVYHVQSGKHIATARMNGYRA